MVAEKKKWLFALLCAGFVTLLLFFSFSAGFSGTYSLLSGEQQIPYVVSNREHSVPAFAYYISGNQGHKDQIFQLMLAVYHPRNRYLLHLGSEASNEERSLLATMVRSVPVIRAFGNVDVMGKPDPLTYMGSTNIAATLHAAAILLKLGSRWDWFITLNALDYPLITQDDLAHVFSSARRDLNFIDHTSDLGWKEQHRIRPIVVDPGIYLARRTQIFTATEKRNTPDAFKVFTGSPWVTLSRPFLEFCILGWDNLPRTLLMYFNNVMLPEEGYFHSVICNAADFRNTTVNSDLRYMVWDNPPKMEPHFLTTSNYDQMISGGALFARQFQKDDPVINMIDAKILKRKHNRATPGAWCSGWNSWLRDPCSQWDDIYALKPGAQAKKLETSLLNLLDSWKSQSDQCK